MIDSPTLTDLVSWSVCAQTSQPGPASQPQPASQPASQVFTDLIERFLLAKQAGGTAKGTILFYRRGLKHFAGQYPAWPPKLDEIEKYMQDRRARVKPITANGNWRTLSIFLNWCTRRQVLASNPMDAMDRPKKIKDVPKPASKNAIRLLFQAIDAEAAAGDVWAIRDAALFRLFYDTGARASEMCATRRADLDIPGNSVYLPRTKDSNGGFVFYGPKAAAALGEWMKYNPTGEWLFPNTEWNQYNRRRMWCLLQKWCHRAKVKISLHQLRHSYGTHAIRSGIDLRMIQAQMGHSSITTTAKYLQADDESRMEAHRRHAPGESL